MTTDLENTEREKFSTWAIKLFAEKWTTIFITGIVAGVIAVAGYHARIDRNERAISQLRLDYKEDTNHFEREREGWEQRFERDNEKWREQHELSDASRSRALHEGIENLDSKHEQLRREYQLHVQSIERRLSWCEALIGKSNGNNWRTDK